MKTAKMGDQVRVHYNIKLTSGEVVGTSRGGQPLTFKIGKGAVLKGLERGVVGMQPNETRTIQISPEDGYGVRNEDLVLTLEKKELPEKVELVPGRTLQYRKETGETMNFIIAGVKDDMVTIDGNHPFAGKTLDFEVILVAIA